MRSHKLPSHPLAVLPRPLQAVVSAALALGLFLLPAMASASVPSDQTLSQLPQLVPPPIEGLRMPDLLQPLIVSVDSPANHVVTRPSAFDGVAKLNITTAVGGVGCSGTLLADNLHILTAAHCLDGNDDGLADVTSLTATFYLSGGPVVRSGAGYTLAPGWNGDFIHGADLGIITLASAAPVSGYGIYTDVNSIGFVATLAGYGRQGTGNTGYQSGTFGTLRTGSNRMDTVWGDITGTPFAFDFDDGTTARDTIGNLTSLPPDLGLGTAEALIAPGDSGGPSFLDGLIVGVHSFVGTFGAPYDLDSGLNGTFGELGGDTRVAAYSGWINGMLSPVPEPQLPVLFAAGLALLYWRTRRPT